jgi:hypothetical protein
MIIFAGPWCSFDMLGVRLQGELKSQRQAIAERDQHTQDLLDVIHQQVPARSGVLSQNALTRHHCR